MSGIDDLLAKAKAEDLPKSDPVNVVIGGELVTLVFIRSDGKEWAAQCAKYPARLDTSIDRSYGYNFHAVVMAVSPKSGRQLVDGEELELTEKQWQGIYSDGVLAGHEFEQIANTVWGLNEWEPQARVAKLKKASVVASATSSD